MQLCGYARAISHCHLPLLHREGAWEGGRWTGKGQMTDNGSSGKARCSNVFVAVVEVCQEGANSKILLDACCRRRQKKKPPRKPRKPRVKRDKTPIDVLSESGPGRPFRTEFVKGANFAGEEPDEPVPDFEAGSGVKFNAKINSLLPCLPFPRTLRRLNA